MVQATSWSLQLQVRFRFPLAPSKNASGVSRPPPSAWNRQLIICPSETLHLALVEVQAQRAKYELEAMSAEMKEMRALNDSLRRAQAEGGRTTREAGLPKEQVRKRRSNLPRSIKIAALPLPKGVSPRPRREAV